MSAWTHIVAIIDIDTYKEDNRIKEVVEKMLANAPKITGSERDADVFVNVLSGYNIWKSGDCEHCKYRKTIKSLDEGGFICDADEDYKCPEGEYQSRVAITVIGDLRDRIKERTGKEYKKFFEYIQKTCDFEVRNECVKILGN